MNKRQNTVIQDVTDIRRHQSDYPPLLLDALVQVAQKLGRELFIVGGTVRDWLLGKIPNDLDFTVDSDAVHCCRMLIHSLGGGTFVPLGTAEEDAGRVVWKGITVDFSSFRLGAGSIEEDLAMRDFTLNGMGISLSDFLRDEGALTVIDPLSGQQDLRDHILRACPDAFIRDPLRMLRGYRLRARFGFTLEENTRLSINEHIELLDRVSAERISYEMDLIMDSDRAYEVIAAMAESGLLFQVIPELKRGVGLEQPESHHLDVFGHSLSALQNMERIISCPEYYYPECSELLQEYLARPGITALLKWSALLHDIGKPATWKIREEKGGRITFYNHDETGRKMVQALGRELRWSNDKRDRASAFVGMHMHPFHLCNVRRTQGLSKKACLKLSKRAGDDLIGLFFLAMADSLAGKGESKPDEMEEELGQLLCDVLDTYAKHVAPALSGPRLLTGQDLIGEFSLQPGPGFAKILDTLQAAQVEGEVGSRAEALEWVRRYLTAGNAESA